MLGSMDANKQILQKIMSDVRWAKNNNVNNLYHSILFYLLDLLCYINWAQWKISIKSISYFNRRLWCCIMVSPSPYRCCRQIRIHWHWYTCYFTCWVNFSILSEIQTVFRLDWFLYILSDFNTFNRFSHFGRCLLKSSFSASRFWYA